MPSEPVNKHLKNYRGKQVRVAIYSFGGPAGQIAVMHKILVEEKK